MPDQLLPQPPPGAPAPPPGEEALRSRRKMKWLVGVGICSMLLLPAVEWGSSHLRRQRHSCGPTESVFNVQQIGLALYIFNDEYGSFPERSTVAEVKRRSGSPLTLGGHSSNDLLAQLLAAGTAQSESMFHARSKSSKKPDNTWDSDATVLSHGECGFAYICGVDAAGSPGTPLIFGPVIPGTRTLDGKSNDGKAVVLKLDNSATSLPIDSSGRIIFQGMDLLDPRQPFWHGKAPDVRWPK